MPARSNCLFCLSCGLLLFASLVSMPAFIYPSLAACFAYTIVAALLILLAGLLALTGQGKTLTITRQTLVFLVLGCYVVIQSFFFHKSLDLWQRCLIISFLLVMALPVLFGQVKDPARLLLIVVTVPAILESLVCILQYVGILHTNDPFFHVTGTAGNPNVTAMFLAMAFPAVLTLLFIHGTWEGKIALAATPLLIVAILLLNCRTAVIGSGLAACLIVGRRYRLAQWLKGRSSLIIAATTLVLVLSVPLAYGAFRYKEASASGRWLIWKISLTMIGAHPLGCGYGQFEKEYALQQAAYFRSGRGSDDERYHAGYVHTAYNEPLQQTVEGGWPGLLLLGLAIIPLLIRRQDGESQGTPALHTGLLVFAVMSLFNFTLQAVPVLCLFVLYTCCLLMTPGFRRIAVSRPVVATLLAGGGIYFLLTQMILTLAHMRNKEALVALQRAEWPAAGNLLKPLAASLAASDTYWINCARWQAGEKRYPEAVADFDKAKAFSSDPELFVQSGYCYQRMGDYDSAAAEFTRAADIEPSLLTPRYALMKLALVKKDTANAYAFARDILLMPPKGISPKAQRYKAIADSILHLKTVR